MRKIGYAGKLFGEFLQFARMPAPRMAELDLSALLAEVRLMLRQRQSDNPVEVLSPPSLPLRGDRGQLMQLLLNLGLNALQASPKGQPVRLMARPAPLLRAVRHAHDGEGEQVEGVRIEVMDEGPGIPEGALERLFDPFFTTKRAGEGSGMGLAIASRIVSEHRGRIEVESERGRTVFAVWLPDDPEVVGDQRLTSKGDTRRYGTHELE